MNLTQLAALIDADILVQSDPERTLSSGFVCDLLSWVMAKGQKDMAWVTVQTHLNVIAVASLHDMACVILPDGIKMEEAVLDKAREEGIAVLSSPHAAFAICGMMYGQGLNARHP